MFLMFWLWGICIYKFVMLLWKFRVLRLQAGHKYCLLGRLSSEVGWNHYDTIKVRMSCVLKLVHIVTDCVSMNFIVHIVTHSCRYLVWEVYFGVWLSVTTIDIFLTQIWMDLCQACWNRCLLCLLGLSMFTLLNVKHFLMSISCWCGDLQSWVSS